MEGPFCPRDPHESFGMSSTGDGSCRVEELARILCDSTKITPSQFTWISPQELCQTLLRSQGHHDGGQHRPCIIVDTRTEDEATGGCVTGAVRGSTRMLPQEVDGLVEHYCAGRRIIFYCLRSQSRAPLAAQKLLQAIDVQGGRCAGDGVDPRVCVVEGGLVALVQGIVRNMPAQIQQTLVSLHDVDQEFPRALIQGLEADKWAVTQTPDGPLVAHASEVQVCSCVWMGMLARVSVSASASVYVRLRMCVRKCVGGCMHACVRAFVCVCMFSCAIPLCIYPDIHDAAMPYRSDRAIPLCRLPPRSSPRVCSTQQ